MPWKTSTTPNSKRSSTPSANLWPRRPNPNAARLASPGRKISDNPTRETDAAGVLTSDEAIVAVFKHERFELAELGDVFFASNESRMKSTHYFSQLPPARPTNSH